MKEKRRSLNRAEISIMSIRIMRRLFEIEQFKGLHRVCSYLSAFNEPDTSYIIKELWFRGCAVAVPVTHTDTGLLSLSYLDAIKDLGKGAYNIKEPKKIKEAFIEDMEAALVPGLAFDRCGNRMGFGKGYYDKLLAGENVLKIGLCYDFQLQGEIPAEPHDVKMDYIVTEKEIVKTGERNVI